MIDQNNGTDMLGGSNVLRISRILREEFDPNSPQHLDSVRNWLDTGNWGSVQFFCEAPYVTVPETVLRKLANSYLHSKGF